MMKKLLIYLLIGSMFFSCNTQNQSNTNKNKLTFDTNEEGEYDIIVFDPQYSTFLNSIARPKNFYSKTYYKNKNIFYVMEWNRRHANPLNYNPSLYEVFIDYQSNIDYGLQLEYKLYNFFEFIKWKYNINLGFN